MFLCLFLLCDSLSHLGKITSVGSDESRCEAAGILGTRGLHSGSAAKERDLGFRNISQSRLSLLGPWSCL